MWSAVLFCFDDVVALLAGLHNWVDAFIRGSGAGIMELAWLPVPRSWAQAANSTPIRLHLELRLSNKRTKEDEWKTNVTRRQRLVRHDQCRRACLQPARLTNQFSTDAHNLCLAAILTKRVSVSISEPRTPPLPRKYPPSHQINQSLTLTLTVTVKRQTDTTAVIAHR